MRVSHGYTVVFDDPNLVSCAGLAPVLQLAERAGLQDLAAEHVRIGKPGGSGAEAKVASLVAGMVAGADSIDDMAVLRHGAMGRLFDGVRAPSTLGTFLRTFTFGHVRQLDAVASRLLINLSKTAPLLAGADQLAYVDIDDTVKRTYGYAKEGAGRGYSGVKGLNALLGIVSTPGSRPVITGARLRRGQTNSAKGAHRFVADTLVTAKACGASGVVIARMDSAFYQSDVVAAVLRHQAHYSITARLLPPVRKAIEAIAADAWTPIKYTNAVWDDDAQQWISEAEVAEVPFTAFSSKAKKLQATGRLIVRRVPDVNPANQNPLFTVYRHHAVFTNSPLPMLEAESAHRGHAIVEQVIADLKAGPLSHLPSGKFWANSAWLVCAAMAFNLTRTAGVLASAFHAKATTGTIRAQLISVPGRLAHSARRFTLHLPTGWPWQTAWERLQAGAALPACQRPVGTARRRSAEVPGGGHESCPLAAMSSAQ